MKIQPLALFILSASVSGLSVAYEKYPQHDDDDTDHYAYSSHQHTSYHHQSSYSHDKSGDHDDPYQHDDADYHDDSEGKTNEEPSDKYLHYQLVGKGYMYEKEVHDMDGDDAPDKAMCFDVDVKEIGGYDTYAKATACFSDVTAAQSGMKLIETIYWYLPDGYLVTRSLSTIQPVLQDTVTPKGYPVTHLSGASSDQNAVLKGYGEYAWHQGTVSQHGMMDWSYYTGAEGDPVYMDAVYALHIKEVKYRWPHWHNWRRHHYYHNDDYQHRGHYKDRDGHYDGKADDVSDSGNARDSDSGQYYHSYSRDKSHQYRQDRWSGKYEKYHGSQDDDGVNNDAQP